MIRDPLMQWDGSNRCRVLLLASATSALFACGTGGSNAPDGSTDSGSSGSSSGSGGSSGADGASGSGTSSGSSGSGGSSGSSGACGSSGSSSSGSSSSGGEVSLTPGANLQTAIANNPAGTTFHLACGAYRLATDDTDHKPLIPKTGDQFIGAGSTCGVPTSEPCAHLTGALRIPADSPDKAWHTSGGLWFNTVGAANVVPPPKNNTALCYVRNGGGSCTPTTAFGACVYPQDLFFTSVVKPRLSAGDDGGVDEWPPAPGFWYFDVTGKHGAANTVWVADDPSSSTVELSAVEGAFQTAFPNDLNPNVVIRNLTIEKFAGVYGTGVIWAYGDAWQVQNNWIEHNHYGGVTANGSNGIRPLGWSVTYNELYENGNDGAGGPSLSSMFANNQFDRNGYANYCNDSGQKWVGTKPTIANNVVNYTNGVGLWFDVFTQSGVFSGNTVVGSSGEGIRCEISHSCSIFGNTVTNNEQLSSDLCVAAHVPWPAGYDYCTGPQTGTPPVVCNTGSNAPAEITLAQSDNSTVGGKGHGNVVSSNCGGIVLSSGTRDSVPTAGNSVTYNKITYTGTAAKVPHTYGYDVAAGGVTPAANTFDFNAYHFVGAGAGALGAANWLHGSGFVTFSQWQAVPQDQHGTATSP
jgi:parallel beta-helix repeat protein